MELQGGVLVPVDIEPVDVSIDGKVVKQWRCHLLKFNEVPTQAQIDAYLAADVDVQRGSHKHSAWLEMLPETKIRDEVAELVHGKVLKSTLTNGELEAIRGKYPKWEPGAALKEGEARNYEDKLYKSKKDQSVRPDKTPPVAVDLYQPAE